MNGMAGTNREAGIPEMVSLREASKRTGLSYNFLRTSCLKGDLVHIRIGPGKFLVNLDLLVEKLQTAHGSIHQADFEEEISAKQE